ncbi:MAG: hypothetical protein WC643_00650 [Parcubacteria group bacterium]|jgi:heme/copper-type cytochrome/quinol oxidase subunit 2
MNLKDYIYKLQQKPVHERKRIAVIATAAGFLIILVIWVVSFNEMNKSNDSQPGGTSASLDDLKTNFQTGKDSIQNMMQEAPSQTGTTETDKSMQDEVSAPSTGSNQNTDNGNAINNPSEKTSDNSVENNIQSKDSVPQLP